MSKLIDLSVVNDKLIALFFIEMKQNGETDRGISVGIARYDDKHISIDYNKESKEPSRLPDEFLSLIQIVEPEMRRVFCGAEFFIPLIVQSLPQKTIDTVSVDIDKSEEAHDQGVFVDHHEWNSLFYELKAETPRAMVILIAAYIDVLLERKLKQLFNRGNSKTQRKLFDSNGSFATFSSKINAARCLGWLDPDVFNDIELIRKIRNYFAHQIHGLSMEDDKIKRMIGRLRIPHRQFYDWGKVRWANTESDDSFVLFTGDPPSGVINVEDLHSEIWFRFASSLVIAHLAANLKVTLLERDGNEEPGITL